MLLGGYRLVESQSEKRNHFAKIKASKNKNNHKYFLGGTKCYVLIEKNQTFPYRN